MKRLIKPNAQVTASSNGTVIFEIPVKWEMRTVMKVPALSLQQAVRVVNAQEYDLPEGSYVDGSYEIDFDRLEE